ncbi:MAG: hypothetical protein MUC63_07370 [Planctomycetes bacterium]|jgi:hypothetical protein|nr:hypothetical protein [Planctomycetota bacterium]
MASSKRVALYAIAFALLATGVPGYLIFRVVVATRPYELRTTADRLQSTWVVPTLEARIPGGRNVVWCASLQLAWNKTCEDLRGDIRLEGDPPNAAALNKKLVGATDIDEGSCLVMSGRISDGIVGDIRDRARARFPGERGPFLSDRAINPQTEWLVYALMRKSLGFKVAFEDLEEPLVFGSAQVRNFGILASSPHRKPELREACKQVLIHDYRSADDFVVELTTVSEGDQLVLARLPAPGTDLLGTVRGVFGRLSSKPEPMAFEDMLRIPRIRFDLTKDFEDLRGNLVLPGPVAKDIPLLQTLQNIRFSLDEKGAELRSEARVSFGCGAPARGKRVLVFDKPFLLAMKRTGSPVPYFALWVDNAELLVPKR